MFTFVPNIEEMISGKKLIKVGTSHALVIPARTMKKKGYTADTVFDIDEDGDALVLRPRKAGAMRALPKLAEPLEIDSAISGLMGSVSFTKEEIDSDPILKSILGL